MLAKFNEQLSYISNGLNIVFVQRRNVPFPSLKFENLSLVTHYGKAHASQDIVSLRRVSNYLVDNGTNMYLPLRFDLGLHQEALGN